IVAQRQQLAEERMREERGHAHGAGVTRGDNFLPGFASARDETVYHIGVNEWLVASEQDNPINVWIDTDQTPDPALDRASNSIWPIIVLNDNQVGRNLGTDLLGLAANHNHNRPATG